MFDQDTWQGLFHEREIPHEEKDQEMEEVMETDSVKEKEKIQMESMMKMMMKLKKLIHMMLLKVKMKGLRKKGFGRGGEGRQNWC